MIAARITRLVLTYCGRSRPIAGIVNSNTAEWMEKAGLEDDLTGISGKGCGQRPAHIVLRAVRQQPRSSISSQHFDIGPGRARSGRGTGPLEKLRGPGSIYRLLYLPDGVALNVIIQQRTTVETHFSIPPEEAALTGTLAILCKEILENSGEPAHSPLYPRPTFHSEEELISILRGLDQLVRKLGVIALSQ